MHSDKEIGEITPEIRAQAEELAHLYPVVYHRFRTSHQALPGSDVTPRMLGVLQHLAASGPLTVSELVIHLSLSKAATTELVNRLEAKELVERMRDQRDQRRVFIWLTEAGRLRANSLPRIMEGDLLAQALARMQTEDRQRLIAGLRALLEAIKEI